LYLEVKTKGMKDNYYNIIEKSSKSDLDNKINKGFLKYNDIQIDVHSLDRELVRIINQALKRKLSLLIVYPISNCQIYPFLALECLSNTYFGDLQKKSERKNSLLITNKTHVRDIFLDFTLDSVIIHKTFYPLGIVLSDGNIQNHSGMKIKGVVQEPRYLFSRSLNFLPKKEFGEKIFSAIIDLDSISQEYFFEKWVNWNNNCKIPVSIYITSNIQNKLIEKIRENCYIWAWDHRSIQNLFEYDFQKLNYENNSYLENPFLIPKNNLQILASESRNFIIPVIESNINKLLSEAWNAYSTLSNIHKDEPENIDLLQFSKKYAYTINRIEHLIEPLNYSEIAFENGFGTSIKQRICSLSKLTENHKQSISSITNSAIIYLQKLYEYLLTHRSGKSIIAVKLLEEAISLNKSLLLITHNNVSNLAFREFLEEKFDYSEEFLLEKRIDILPFKELHKLNDCNYDNITFSGEIPYFNFNCFDFLPARNKSILSYEIEQKRIIKTWNEYYKLMYNYTSPSILAQTLSKLFEITLEELTTNMEINSQEKQLLILEEQDGCCETIDTQKISGEWLYEPLELDWESNVKTLDIENQEYEDGEIIPSIQLIFENSSFLFIPENKSIPIYNLNQSKIDYLKFPKFKKGDIVILIDRGLKTTLFDKILETIRTNSYKMVDTVVFSKLWIKSFQKSFVNNKDNFDNLLNELKLRGSNITSTLTLYNWLNGFVIGPQDLINIKRIGEIYSNNQILDNFSSIASAIRKVRSIHIKISKKLINLIPKAGIKIQDGSENTLIDKDLDLYLEDFTDIISLERIESIISDKEITSENLNIIFEK